MMLTPVAAGEFFLRWGCGTLAQQIISQTILHNKSNRQADLDPAPLPSVFLPEFSSQTDIGDCTELGSCPELISPLYNYYFLCVVQGGRRPSALYWPAATG